MIPGRSEKRRVDGRRKTGNWELVQENKWHEHQQPGTAEKATGHRS